MQLSQVECILCENKFGSYCVPKSSEDRPASKTILRGGVWERETIDLMRARTGNRSIVHAGMFFGDFLPALSSALAPGQTLFGFEPNPENSHCAQWTARLNGLRNVVLSNAGLGRRKSIRPMQTCEDGQPIGGRSRIVTNAERQQMPDDDLVSVSIVAVDDVIPKDANIGIIQLDVEGYEAAALAGSLLTIRRCLPLLILETTPDGFIEEHLTPLGYRPTDRVRNNNVFEVQT